MSIEHLSPSLANWNDAIVETLGKVRGDILNTVISALNLFELGSNSRN